MTTLSPRGVIDSLELQGKTLQEANEHEPWGGYYRFQDTNTEYFVDRFYPEIAKEAWVGSLLLRPTVAVVNPDGEIPMHQHRERAEIIKVVSGSMVSTTVSRCNMVDTRGIGEGDLLLIEPGEGHGFKAGLSGLVFVELWGRATPLSEPGVDDFYLSRA